MEIGEALAVLGLGSDASFEDMRAAYRTALLAHHPDRSNAEGTTETTAAVVEAFRLLRGATNDGTVPLPASSAVIENAPDETTPVLLTARPGDVFGRLMDATEAVGEISFIDRSSSMLQAVVALEGFAACQLTAEVDASKPDPEVLFTMEAITAGNAPNIVDVVALIAPHL